MKSAQYSLTYKLDMDISVNVNASSLEDAIAQAKELSMREILTTDKWEWLDGDGTLRGVYEV